jgi:hypothetical protein
MRQFFKGSYLKWQGNNKTDLNKQVYLLSNDPVVAVCHGYKYLGSKKFLDQLNKYQLSQEASASLIHDSMMLSTEW